ncbi:MAG TPA: hypothetical protein VKU01_29320 [Bryobacteraceae bacterium]|nr:hypothetical protein [Bryobacteraceae bacterium]
MKRRFPLWVATLPAVLFMLFAMSQFSRVAGVVGPGSGGRPATSKRLGCVETYGISLDLSEYYVRDLGGGIPVPSKTQTPELSTVMRGMARNGCGEQLKNVRLRFVVHDDVGRKGEGTYLIDSMADGEVKSFERAWMGRVTSYEIGADR